MKSNVIFIGIFILILIILATLLGLIFMKVIIPLSDFIGKKLAKKMRSKKWLYILELYFIFLILSLLVISLLYAPFTKHQLVYMTIFFLFIILILIEASTYSELRKLLNLRKELGIIGWISNTAIWQTYFARRLLQFIEHIAYTFYLVVPLYLSLLIMSILSWSDHDYFYSLLFLPIYSNVWVYIKFNRKNFISFNSNEVIFMRRLIIYVLIIGYSIVDSNSKFSELISNNKSLSFEYIFVSSAAIIYIALDRLLKEIASDKEKYNKEKSEREKIEKDIIDKEKKRREEIREKRLRRIRI